MAGKGIPFSSKRGAPSAGGCRVFVLFFLLLMPGVALTAAAQDSLVAYQVRGDAIDAPLTPVPGDPARGKQVVVDREAGHCLICHAIPDSGERFMGNVGPSLSGVGTRLSAGQIRLRLVDPTRAKPDAVMPSYYRIEGLRDVAGAWRGKPILTARQIEDAVAYLATLKGKAR